MGGSGRKCNGVRRELRSWRTLCRNGRWRAFDGGATGTTPFQVFFKDGVFRGSP